MTESQAGRGWRKYVIGCIMGNVRSSILELDPYQGLRHHLHLVHYILASDLYLDHHI